MTPGPTIIKKCSVCSKQIKQHTIGSGNTFGATFWTDGKREAPMLPDQLLLVLCPHCHASLWIDELIELGEVEPWGDGDSTFNDAIEYKTPSIDDYFVFLEKGVATHEKEHYVRLRAWWAGNDVRRTSNIEVPILPQEISNLTTLSQMLDESNANNILMKAEVMRELSRFEDAGALLATLDDKDLSEAVDIISSLVEKGDPYVREIHFK